MQQNQQLNALLMLIGHYEFFKAMILHRLDETN